MSIFKLVRLTCFSHFVSDVKFNNDVRTLHHQIDISHRYVDIMIGTVIRLIFRMRNCNTISRLREFETRCAIEALIIGEVSTVISDKLCLL